MTNLKNLEKFKRSKEKKLIRCKNWSTYSPNS